MLRTLENIGAAAHVHTAFDVCDRRRTVSIFHATSILADISIPECVSGMTGSTQFTSTIRDTLAI